MDDVIAHISLLYLYIQNNIIFLYTYAQGEIYYILLN